MALDIKNIEKRIKSEQGKSIDFSKITDFLKKDYHILSTKGLSDSQKESFYSELHILLNSGIDLKISLELIWEQKSKKKEKGYIESVIHSITQGQTLSESMRISGGFSEYEYYSINIGEESGKLIEVIKQLLDYYNNKIKQKRKVVGALSYPVFVFLVTLVVVSFMLMFIVPMFEDIFTSFKGELPAITKAVINVSEHFSGIILFMFLLFVIISVFVKINKHKSWYRNYTSRIILKIPVIGPLNQKIQTARFCQSMALLLGADVPVIRVLQLVRKMIRFYPFEVALEATEQMVYKGMQLNECFRKFSIFDQRLVIMVKVAEEVNKLDEVFDQLKLQYSNEVEHRLNILNNLMEPVMILIVGFFVAVILISMYLPLFHLSTSVF